MFNSSTFLDKKKIFQPNELDNSVFEGISKSTIKDIKKNKFPTVGKFFLASSVLNISYNDFINREHLGYPSVIIQQRINRYISSREAYNLAISSFDRYQEKLDKYIKEEFQSLLEENEK
jgi:hypothetical protein